MSILSDDGLVAASGNISLTNSVRCRSAGSTYLSRTPSVTGNRQKFTISAWVKKSALAVNQVIFSACDTTATDGTLFYFGFTNADYLQVIGGTTTWRVTNAVYRDVGAWYHCVCSVDTTTQTINLYVNGVQITSFLSSNAITSNLMTAVNGGVQQRFGATNYSSPFFFDGYLSDCYLIDGAALTPTSFGKFDSNGVWVPVKYTGSYGTNGIHLEFKNAGALGTDTSGNGNTFTSNGFATSDQMVDTPSNNYCTLSPIETIVNSSSLSDGNLTQPGYGGTGGSSYNAIATMGVSSGKWYWECKLTTRTQTGSLAGICGPGVSGNLSRDFYGYYEANGNKYSCAAGAGSFTTAAFGSAWNTGVVLGIAFDADAGTLAYYLAGTLVGTAFTGISSTSHSWFPCSTGSGGQDGMTFNFGQSTFAYTPPTGFKSLCTSNLPAVAITKPKNYHNEVLYTGTGNLLNVTGVGFNPDMVWMKSRSNTLDHGIIDSVRGSGYVLVPNTTAVEGSSGPALITDGFAVGSGYIAADTSGATYVAWNWKKGSTPGFDIVAYTGTGSATTFSHSLGAVPAFIIIKQRNGTWDWLVYHKTLGNTQCLLLDSTAAASTNSTYWNNTSPTSSVFSVGTHAATNGSGSTYIAYLWAEVPGFSKFGSYTGNGNADGPFIHLGFKPKYVMVKRSDSAGNDWFIYDSARDTYNVMGSDIYGNLSNAEATGNARFDFTSNGFKLRNTFAGVNANGSTYIYTAFAENPFGGSNVAPCTAR